MSSISKSDDNFYLLSRFASHYLKEVAASGKSGPQRPCYNILYGNLNRLPTRVRFFVEENAKVCQPDSIHICDGSEKERDLLLYILQRDGTITPLPKYENW